MSAAQQLRQTLADCPALDDPSEERDELWLTVRQVVCTRAALEVSPLGSQARVRVSSDQATDELLAAMSWLYAHEAAARELDAAALFSTLRGVATRGASGSGRAAQSDLLHGMTGVPGGRVVRWGSLSREEQPWV